jgi:hypothetical protein
MSKLGKYGRTTIIQNNSKTFLYSHRVLQTTLTEQLHRKLRGGATLPLVGFRGNRGVITGELTRVFVDPEDV